jgi:hypothetical protein
MQRSAHAGQNRVAAPTTYRRRPALTKKTYNFLFFKFSKNAPLMHLIHLKMQ